MSCKAANARPHINLRVSLTDRCQLRCRYCMPETGIKKVTHNDILSYAEIILLLRILQQEFIIDKVRITGGDPLVRGQVEYFVAMLTELSIPEIALTTNAQLLPAKAVVLKAAGLQRVNISLDTLKPEVYTKLTRKGKLAATISGIKEALRINLTPVKINSVIMRTWNLSEVIALARFGLEHNCQIRFLELMPIGEAGLLFAQEFVSNQEVKDIIDKHFSLQPVPRQVSQAGNNFIARDSSGRKGIIGFISPNSQPFCHDCQRLRLTGSGILYGCLARKKGLDLRKILRNRNPGFKNHIITLAHQALAEKRKNHCLEHQTLMSGIGG